MDDREKLISDYRNKIREHLEVEAKYESVIFTYPLFPYTISPLNVHVFCPLF